MLKSRSQRVGLVALLCLVVTSGAAAQTAPALDVVWGAAEFEAMYAYMGTLDLADYPRVDGNGSELFEKLITSVEQDVFLDTTIPVEQRAALASRMQLSLAAILMQYVGAISQGEDVATELIHTMGCTLVGSRQLMALMEEALLEVDPNDGDKESREQGLARAKAGLGQQI